MTAEHTSIYGKVGVVWVDTIERRSKGHVVREAVRWGARTDVLSGISWSMILVAKCVVMRWHRFLPVERF
jgi:hypothetical protein